MADEENDSARKPLLMESVSEDKDCDVTSSPIPNYLAINSFGPQFCYSPLIGNVDSPSREPTPSNQTEEEEGGNERRPEYGVFKRRWYVLIVFSLLSATQGLIWNTFSPISSTVKDAFGWDNSMVALLTNWGPIVFLPAVGVFSWLIDVKGLRAACLLTAFAMALGTVLRCVSMDNPAVTWLMNLGQLLNGLGGPVAMAGPPAVSAVWFPPHQRTTATATGTFFCIAGVGVSFILGPLIVPDVPKNATNGSRFHTGRFEYEGPDILLTDVDYGISDCHHAKSSHNETRKHRIRREKRAIMLYMYIQAGWAILLFLVTLLYFPMKPPLPPCVSANTQREGFLTGIKRLMSRKQFWMVCFVYGVSVGVYNVWMGIMHVILKPNGIGEREAGWIGLYATISAGLLSLIAARFSDAMSRVMKWIVVGLYVTGTVSFLVFTLAASQIIAPSTALFYLTIIVGTVALNSGIPLLFEMACEMAYPVGEGTANGVMTFVNNLTGVIYLLIFMIPHIGTMWTNWALMGATAVSLPILLLMNEKYSRLEVDTTTTNLSPEVNPNPSQQEPVETTQTYPTSTYNTIN